MFNVYILKNSKERFYIGYTSKTVEERLHEHNHGNCRWTRDKGPWKICYVEALVTREEAYRRERQLKSYKGGRAFKALLVFNRHGEVA